MAPGRWSATARELVDTAAGSLGSWRDLIVPVLVLSKRSGKCYDRCLMPWVAYVHKVAHKLQQHALAAGHAALPSFWESFVEIADLDPKRSGDKVEPAGRDPVQRLLVLMRLLVGNANQLGRLLLRPAEQDLALAHPSANVVVDSPAAEVCLRRSERTSCSPSSSASRRPSWLFVARAAIDRVSGTAMPQFLGRSSSMVW